MGESANTERLGNLLTDISGGLLDTYSGLGNTKNGFPVFSSIFGGSMDMRVGKWMMTNGEVRNLNGELATRQEVFLPINLFGIFLQDVAQEPCLPCFKFEVNVDCLKGIELDKTIYRNLPNTPPRQHSQEKFMYRDRVAPYFITRSDAGHRFHDNQLISRDLESRDSIPNRLIKYRTNCAATNGFGEISP